MNIHYAPAGGSWTAVPGVPMAAVAGCAGRYRKDADLGGATGMRTTVNNGAGSWDNNNGANYALSAGTSTVKDGVVTGDATGPCAAAPADTTAPSTPAQPLVEHVRRLNQIRRAIPALRMGEYSTDGVSGPATPRPER